MPFKSDAQRRWMYSNKPALARKWSTEYKNYGGKVDMQTKFYSNGNSIIDPNIEAQKILKVNQEAQFILSKYMNEGGKVKDNLNSNQILVRDPRWSVIKDILPGIKGLFSGLEELVELPGTIYGWAKGLITGDYSKGYNVDLTPDKINKLNNEALAVAIEILSDYYGDPEKGANEAIKLFSNSELFGSLIDPLIAFKAPKLLKVLSKYDIEVDPNTLGSNLGNIKIVKKGTAGAQAIVKKYAVQYPDGTLAIKELTYQELAELTGKNIESVKKSANRGNLIKGSDGIRIRIAKEGETTESLNPDSFLKQTEINRQRSVSLHQKYFDAARDISKKIINKEVVDFSKNQALEKFFGSRITPEDIKIGLPDISLKTVVENMVQEGVLRYKSLIDKPKELYNEVEFFLWRGLERRLRLTIDTNVRLHKKNERIKHQEELDKTIDLREREAAAVNAPKSTVTKADEPYKPITTNPLTESERQIRLNNLKKGIFGGQGIHR